jgi:hypothetical protein
MGIVSLIKGMSGKRASVTDSTHCINKEIIYSGGNDVAHVQNEGFLHSINVTIKINL